MNLFKTPKIDFPWYSHYIFFLRYNETLILSYFQREFWKYSRRYGRKIPPLDSYWPFPPPPRTQTACVNSTLFALGTVIHGFQKEIPCAGVSVFVKEKLNMESFSPMFLILRWTNIVFANHLGWSLFSILVIILREN